MFQENLSVKCSGAALPNRNTMGTTYKIQNFLGGILKKKLKVTDEIHFNSILFDPGCPKYFFFNT